MESLRVVFKNVREIRMGSPFRVCDVKFEGEWAPPLPRDDWQDLAARNPSGSLLALVRWNTSGNEPGFHVVRIDIKKKKIHKTKRIYGMCEKLFWDGKKFSWERFPG